jgi:hypothetical protein
MDPNTQLEPWAEELIDMEPVEKFEKGGVKGYGC